MWRLRCIPLCFVALAIGCGGVGFVYEKRLVGDIGLVACDTKEQMALTDFAGGSAGHLVPATVFAVGWDESHVVAKRHPRKEPFGPTDKTRTEYFIVVVRNRKAYGPFDETEFWMHRDFFGVAEGMGFALMFRELE